MWLEKSIKPFVARLLPQTCLLCGARAEQALCAACEADLPRLNPPLCPRCALPLGHPAAQCGACLSTPPPYTRTYATFAYAFPVDRLLLALKFGQAPLFRRLAIAQFCAERMLAGPRPPGDLLVPIPLARARLAARGFNQALEIARPLARAAGIPLAAEALQRVRETAPQTSLSQHERRRNLKNAFQARLDCEGRHVILVDDVMTTGSTLAAAATALLAAGAKEVSNWVVARAY
ncbi:MAG: phosphoribosyltransferase family protein [Rhodocyclaceae bacterium]|nr:phosphoribosyltransferase family protein [Rhodocyclaceae bacterium]